MAEELRLNTAQRMIRTVENAAVTLAAGQMICMTGGHGWFYGLEADGPDAVRRAARVQIKARSDWVKFMASGGFAEAGEQPGAVQLDLVELTAGVQEARKVGLPTAAHAHGAEAIKNVLRAGIDSVEHASFPDDEAIELMLKTGAFIVPTFTVYYKMKELGPSQGLDPYLIDLVNRSWERKLERFAVMWKAGVPVAAGSDNGSPLAPHGDIVTELQLLVQAGLTPYDALAAATVNAARLLRLDAEIGTVEPGKRADLVILGADPLQDVQAARRVHSVMKDGRLYSPAASAHPQR